MDKRHRKQKTEVDGHSQPVPLPVAASLVYHQLNRKLNPGDINGALASTAFALSQVADIYYVEEEGRLAPIPKADLAHGVFEATGASFRAASGRVFGPLVMRRGDLMEAIVILKAASADRRQV